MAKIVVVHRNIETQQFDIGKNDKVTWITLQKDDGSLQKFFPEKSPEELKAIWKAEHDRSIALRKISYANAEKTINKCHVEEFKNILNDIWDGNATAWLDHPGKEDTNGHESIMETGFTTNQMRWIKKVFKIFQGDE
ncbi:hypothetical protein KAU43_03735 [candidate division WOR-3 bacterium]|nr:hypothetical protein [candidate division WOR-3 bacterium]